MTEMLTKEFSNAAVRVTLRHLPACKVELDVVASKGLIDQAKSEAIKAVRKEVSLPGFRKGKAPEIVILKKYPHQVEEESKKILANLSFQEVRSLVSLSLLGQNSVTFDLKSKTEEEAHLLFSCEVEPAVSTADLGTFVPKPIEMKEVTKEQIHEAIEQMRFYYANWKPVTERTLQEGDYIMIDLDTWEGEAFKNVFHNVRFEVSKKRMANWMKELVLNAKAGDILEGMSQADEDASEKDKLEFQPKKVRLTIHKVEEAELPPIDDEFAKKVGAPDVAAMEASIRSLFQKQLDDDKHNKLREQVNEFLLEKAQFELPASQLEAEKKHRVRGAMQDIRFRKEWNQMSQEQKTEWDVQVTKEAKDALHLFYLSRQIVRDGKVPVTHKEVQDEAISTLTQMKKSGEKVDFENISREMQALALSKVILRKAQDLILSGVKEEAPAASLS